MVSSEEPVEGLFTVTNELRANECPINFGSTHKDTNEAVIVVMMHKTIEGLKIKFEKLRITEGPSLAANMVYLNKLFPRNGRSPKVSKWIKNK